jgi:Protein of unknown function (DUF3800)
MPDFSDYIIYVDESGSPVLAADREDFPVFVLVFMIVHKRTYAEQLVPKIQMLKFDFVGHDQVILHERDIRRQSGAFAFLQVSKQIREAFIARTTAIIEEAEISFCCAIIDKISLTKQYADPWSPYDLALTFCLEKASKALLNKGQEGREVAVVFEARGSNEDQHLELEFRRVIGGKPIIGSASQAVAKLTWKPLFVDKRANSTGLQLADLAARPLGLSYLRPEQANRAVKVLKKKMEFPHPKCFP